VRGRKKQISPQLRRSLTLTFPKPPRTLSKAARAEWKKVESESITGTITALDTQSLAAFCENVALYWKAKGKLEREGEVITSPKGYPIQSPWLSIANRAEQRMLKLATELGLTPVSGNRLPGANGVPGDGTSIENFMQGPKIAV